MNTCNDGLTGERAHCAPCWHHVLLHRLPDDEHRQSLREFWRYQCPYPCVRWPWAHQWLRDNDMGPAARRAAKLAFAIAQDECWQP